MRTTSLLALAAATPSTLGALVGFNYGSTYTDGTVKVQSDYEGEFNSAKNTVGQSFTSARLYTTQQGGQAAGTPNQAFQAAINTQTELLIGLWASGGDAGFQAELQALVAAVNQYGTALTSLVAGISVGSEDIYRTTELGIASNAGPGVTPEGIVNYVGQVRSALANTAASGILIGHVDTYNVYTNSSNAAVIPALDFLGVDAYPYYETTKANSIDTANATFWDDLSQTIAVAQGKPVWVTETGWPLEGPTSGQAVASVENSATYYHEVACSLFAANINTWWFTQQDQQPSTPAGGVVFGIAGAGVPPPTTPLFTLGC